MSTDENERARGRRWSALLVLVVGALLALTTLNRSVPKEQPLVFRLPQHPEFTATALAAQLTPAGQREPIAGVSIALDSPQPREVRRPLRVPDGDYIVSVELTWNHSSGPSAPVKTETSRTHRVSLTGHETLVVLDSKGL
jgi:hypothetical protein